MNIEQERKDFEARYTIPKDVEWNEARQAYCWIGRNVIAPFDDIWCTYEDGLNTRASRDQWISVDDRLPDEGEWVIGATYILEPITGKSKRISKELFFDGENEDGIHWLCDGDWPHAVTHWMPLPEPPEAP